MGKEIQLYDSSSLLKTVKSSQFVVRSIEFAEDHRLASGPRRLRGNHNTHYKQTDEIL